MKKRLVLGVLPAVGVSSIPVLACPACLPVLASVLGAVGLTFLTSRTYLLWINLAALALALTILFAKRRTNGYAPILLGTAGATLIMLGKFVLVRNAVAWSGLVALIVASALTGIGNSNASCGVCGDTSSALEGGSQHGKEKS